MLGIGLVQLRGTGNAILILLWWEQGYTPKPSSKLFSPASEYHVAFWVIFLTES